MSSASTNGPATLLKLEGINTYYGQMHILQNVNLEVGVGELRVVAGSQERDRSFQQDARAVEVTFEAGDARELVQCPR